MTEKDIKDYYNKAVRTALTLLEQKARHILQNNSNLDEFVMAMGGWFFTRKVGTKDHHGIVVTGEHGDDIIHEPLAYMHPVADIINEWDEYLKLTGTPMRFTAWGPTRKDW